MTDPEVLSREEIERLLQVTPGDTPAAIRNRALLVALFADGRRIKEVVDLTAAEAEWEDFASSFREPVDAWLRERDKLGFPHFGPMFSSAKGDALTVGYVRALVIRTRAKAARLTGDVDDDSELIAGFEPEPEPGPPPPLPPPPPPTPEPEPEPEPPQATQRSWGPPPPPREDTAQRLERRPIEPVAPPPPAPPPPPRRGFFSSRSPLALILIGLGALLLAGGGIAAGVALTHKSKASTSTDAQKTTGGTTGATTHHDTTSQTHTTSTQETTATTDTTSGTTTAPPPAAGTLAFVPGQSYCQAQAHHQLGFWATLQNTGDKDIDGVGLVAIETYAGTAHSNPRIQGLKVPAHAPQLQTVVSYRLSSGAKVTACSIKIYSAAFPKSGKAQKLELRSA